MRELSARLVERYAKGGTARAAGAAEGITPQQTIVLLRRAGVKIRGAKRRPPTPTPEMIGGWVAEYAAGASTASIGEAAGYTPNAVIRHLRERGVALRRSGWTRRLSAASILLEDLAGVATRIQAHDEARTSLIDERDELVRAALRTELRRVDISDAAGVTEPRLYQIRDGR